MSHVKNHAPDHVFEPQDGSGRDFPPEDIHSASPPSRRLESPYKSSITTWANIDQPTGKVIIESMGHNLAYWVAAKKMYKARDMGAMIQWADGAIMAHRSWIRSYRYWFSKDNLKHLGLSIRQELVRLKSDPFFNP